MLRNPRKQVSESWASKKNSIETKVQHISRRRRICEGWSALRLTNRAAQNFKLINQSKKGQVCYTRKNVLSD